MRSPAMNASQTEFVLGGVARGQNALLLAALEARRGQWVPMVELGREIGAWAVHSRAADLRRLGYEIENRRERVAGKVHSFYRLA